MERRRSLMAFSLVVFMLVMLLGGCSGQSNDESQDNASTERAQEQRGGQTGLETKTAIGRVVRAEDRRFVVRSATGEEDGQRMVFITTKNARITLNGQEASLADIKKGQQAQVKYYVRNDRNRAREVVLFGQGTPENGGTTG